MSFKENLRDEMNYQGILLKELAAKSGVSKGSLSNYLKESASIPSADVAVKIAHALNVSVEYLVSGKNSSPTDSLENSLFQQRNLNLLKSFLNLSERDKCIVEKLIAEMCK